MHLNRTNQKIASHLAAQALEAALQSKSGPNAHNQGERAEQAA